LPESLLEIISKLLFKHEVDPLYLLLFPKLLTVTGKHFSAGSTVLSRRIGTALFDRARGFKAAISLQK
jgi:hypothetical protein